MLEAMDRSILKVSRGVMKLREACFEKRFGGLLLLLLVVVLVACRWGLSGGRRMDEIAYSCTYLHIHLIYPRGSE